ncbi:hypothetical protein [Streptococcus minor]|uniref:hypothetical protein n=1 Tax=Streptococcus minor TaxID=229549 RepID=UPI000375064E|nr:hypothetical protein [Streptococcus minor]
MLIFKSILVFLILIPLLIFWIIYPIVLIWIPIKKVLFETINFILKLLPNKILKVRLLKSTLLHLRKLLNCKNKKLFKSFLNIPIIQYPNMIFVSVLWYRILPIPLDFIEGFGFATELRILTTMEFLTLVNYVDIIIVHWGYGNGSNRGESIINNILTDFDVHIDLLKKIIGPASLIGIVSAILSMSNMFFPEYLKKNMEVVGENINQGTVTLFVFLGMLILYSSVNYFIILLITHIVKYSQNYLSWYEFTVKKFFRWINIF